MELIPPPSQDAQKKIQKAAVMARKDGKKEEAAALLERCFTETPAQSKDRLYYASAVIALGLNNLIQSGPFRRAVIEVHYEQPLLDEPESLRAEFTREYPQKKEPPRKEGFLASLFGGGKKKGASVQKGYALLNKAIGLMRAGSNWPEANRLAREALEFFRQAGDARGEADALHFQGRIFHEQERLEEAMACYDQALEIARYHNLPEQIARAMHERARIYHRGSYDFMKAEECYRYALNYYASVKDEANVQASIDSLGQLGQDALSNDEFFLPQMEREGVPVGQPAGFLHVRGAVMKAEFFTHYNKYLDLLVRWTGQEAERDLPFARYILRELERVARMHQDERYISQAEALKRQLPR